MENLRHKLSELNIDLKTMILSLILILFVSEIAIGSNFSESADKVSSTFVLIIFDLVLGAIVASAVTYVLSSALFIKTGIETVSGVLVSIGLVTIFYVFNSYEQAEEIAGMLKTNFGYIMTCGTSGQDGMAGLLNSDPSKSNAFQMFFGVDVGEVSQLCNLSKQVGYLPAVAFIENLIWFGAIWYLNKRWPVNGWNRD